MNYHPPPKRTPVMLWVATAFAAVGAVIASFIGFAVAQGAFDRHYTVAEVLFLNHVKRAEPSPGSQPWAQWPHDAELVSEGHQICAILATHHGDRDAPIMTPIFGRPDVPTFMEQYPMSQREELVAISVENLCTDYAVWIGGSPI